MISAECIMAYWMQYPNGSIGYCEPDGGLTVEDGDISYKAPEDETDETFMDRLKRSIKIGRNLFFEEWEADTEPIDPNAIY